MNKHHSFSSLCYKAASAVVGLSLLSACGQGGSPSFTQVSNLVLNDSSYFETRGPNMEFFPSVFFEHSYLMDGKPGRLPVPLEQERVRNSAGTRLHLFGQCGGQAIKVKKRLIFF